MIASKRPRRIPRGAEVALALGVGAASFALVGVVVAAVDPDVLVALFGVACVVAIVGLERAWGVQYAVPAAMAALLAYDWYQFPPTHPLEFPDAGNLANLLAVLGVAVLIGELAAYASRRAEVSEAARAALAEEQAALRRVATLVARHTPTDQIFTTVADEVRALLDVDGARVVCVAGDDGAALDAVVPAAVRQLEVPSAVGAPIVVDGRPWGALLAWSLERPLVPESAAARLTDFTELVATAISNAADREELARLADEQAALRRVATLVALGVAPPDVFTAVAREVGQLLDVDATHIGRYEDDATTAGVGSWSRAGDHIPVGTRAEVGGDNVTTMVRQTGRPARMDSYAGAQGSIAARLHAQLGIRSSVGAPITAEGRLWGVMIASSKEDRPLPADTEARIAAFTELMATAIANTEARTEVGRLADEQAALRRVATLVAQGVPRAELFAAVAAEVGRLLGTDLAGMIRYEGDEAITAVATWAAVGEHPDAPGRRPLDGGELAATIARTHQPARIDAYDEAPGRIVTFARDGLEIRSSVGSPIVVEGRLWGALIVGSTHAEPLPLDTESRIAAFSDLVATAIANAEVRAGMRRLADEQAALRRVATLVARESPAQEVFATVAAELSGLLVSGDSPGDITMFRFEHDGTATVVANGGQRSAPFAVGTCVTLEGGNIIAEVLRTGQSARLDDYTRVTGSIAVRVRAAGIRSAVASPITVGGRIWGAMAVASREPAAMPAGTEARIGQFTELIATAISNLETRSELAASRARIVAATDQERRRLVRDLHDGAQQRLVHTVITLKLARQALLDGKTTAPTLVDEALDHADQATAEVRELAHGILPAVLTHGGLRAGVDALAARMPVPVETDVSVGRLPASVEATAYFVVAEALTNVAKHAEARRAAVVAHVEGSTLRLRVRDDGVGGARPDGSGLVGLADRLAAIEGRLSVESPADGGTLVAAAIPLTGRTARH